jgi:hypothetical protein
VFRKLDVTTRKGLRDALPDTLEHAAMDTV